MWMEKYKNAIWISVGIVNIFIIIILNYLYGNQGLSAYIYLPVQIIFVSIVCYLSSRISSFFIFKYILVIFISFLFMVFVRGSGIKRTPLSDLFFLINNEEIRIEDLISDNSLKRKLAQKKYGVSDEYYLCIYVSLIHNLRFEFVILNNNDDFVILESDNVKINNRCLQIGKNTRFDYCFNSSPSELRKFDNDSITFLVIRSNEISTAPIIDNFILKNLK